MVGIDERISLVGQARRNGCTNKIGKENAAKLLDQLQNIYLRVQATRKETL